MKKFNIKVWAGAMAFILLVSSCEDYLDINKNPNQATVADVNLVLPLAIVASASTAVTYNNYGGHFGGFIANAGGYSGFGNLLSYSIGPGDYNGLWTTIYQDPLHDLDYVIKKTEGNEQMAYYNAAAKIITAYNYGKLVDAFGNIPYTQALRGEELILTPEYDDAFSVYQDLFAKLGDAIDLIENSATALTLTAASDPLYGDILTRSEDDGGGASAQMLQWQKFANTLRLRILVKLATKGQTDGALGTFVTTGFAEMDNVLGYITEDALVDPGYELNRPNPMWATWGRTVTGAISNDSRIPTTYSFGFFNGVKIQDDARGEAMFVNYPTTPTNQLGNEVNNLRAVAGTPQWYSSEHGGDIGILKGPGMAQSLMLRAEAMFLIAEAQLNGDIPSLASPGNANAEESFNTGIKAHINYIHLDVNEALGIDTTGMFADYLADNSGNRLVVYDLAGTATQQLEAIITQKYIANLMINSDEAFNDFRRTGFPATTPGGSASADIASNKSTSTRTDKLISRVLYPSSEQSFNLDNYVPINQFADLIFWDPN